MKYSPCMIDARVDTRRRLKGGYIFGKKLVSRANVPKLSISCSIENFN